MDPSGVSHHISPPNSLTRLSDSEISDIDDQGLPRGHGHLPGVDPNFYPARRYESLPVLPTYQQDLDAWLYFDDFHVPPLFPHPLSCPCPACVAPELSDPGSQNQHLRASLDRVWLDDEDGYGQQQQQRHARRGVNGRAVPAAWLLRPKQQQQPLHERYR